MADERVQIVIEAQDKASPALQNVGSNLDKLQAASAAPSRLATGFNGLVTGIGAAATALGVFGRAFDQALDYGAVGASLVNLERSFYRFAEASGQSADVVLSEMQRMSSGMLTESQSMQQFNRAYLLMGEEMAAKMPQLIQVATAASAAGMGDFQFLLNSLVIGLGRTSPLILDNLGFTVKLEDAYGNYAASVGKAASELSKAEQQQALLNAVMADAQKKFGDLSQVSDMAGLGISRLRTQMAELREEAARVASGPIDDVAKGLSGDLTQLGAGLGIDALAGNGRILAQMEESLASYNKRVEEGASFWDKITGQAPNLEMMQGEVLGLAQGLDIVTLSAEDLATVMALLEKVAPGASAEFRVMNREAFQQRNALEELRGATTMAGEALKEMGAGARIAQVDMKGLNQAIGSAITLAGTLSSAAMGARGALQGMAVDLRVSMMKASDFARGIEKPQMDWFTTGKKAWEMPEAVAEYGRAMGTWIENQGRQVWRDHEESISSAGAAYGGLTDSMESYYDAWKSKADGIASSILSPTQDVNLAAMEEKLYGRQDAFDENARRAMDVFEKGTESPWAEQLGLGSKEDAFQYIKDFYAGKLPEDQYNWDAAIGQYQDQMEQSIGADSLQKMFEEKLIGAGWGPEGAALTDALQAPMGDGGTVAAETFAGTFTAYGWVTPGTTAGEMILTGLRQRLEKGDSRVNAAVEALVIKTVKNFIGAGGELP